MREKKKVGYIKEGKANDLRMCGFPSHEISLLNFSFGGNIYSFIEKRILYQAANHYGVGYLEEFCLLDKVILASAQYATGFDYKGL